VHGSLSVANGGMLPYRQSVSVWRCATASRRLAYRTVDVAQRDPLTGGSLCTSTLRIVHAAIKCVGYSSQ
jgi:hypothetical protein